MADEVLDVEYEIAALERLLAKPHFDEGLLEQAERLLTGAFSVSEPMGRSPVELFNGRRRQGSIALKRCSQAWTLRVHASATKRARFSRPLIQPNDFLKAKAVRVVSSLPESQLCYLRYAFMPEGMARTEYGARYERIFLLEYQPRLAGTRLDRRVLSDMARMAIVLGGFSYDDARRTNWSGAFGIERSNWSRRYRDHWFAMLDAVNLHHKESLIAFYNKY